MTKPSNLLLCAAFAALTALPALAQPPQNNPMGVDPTTDPCFSYFYANDMQGYADCQEQQQRLNEAIYNNAVCQLPYMSYLCDATDAYNDLSNASCPAGQIRSNGICVTPASCSAGYQHDANYACVPIPCPIGQTRNSAGVCVGNNGSPQNPHTPSYCYPGNQIPACYDDPITPPNPPPQG